MNILHLSAVDFGGAGVQAASYCQYFAELGYNSKLLVLESKTQKNCIVYKKRLIDRIKHRIAKTILSRINTKEEYCFFNKFEAVGFVSAGEIIKQCNFNPDIIFIHWVSDFINAKTIRRLKERTGCKIYWCLMDNAPLTGGCHYPWDCIGYQTDCSNCPAILNPMYKKLSKINLHFKKKYLPTDVTIITGGLDYYRTKKSVLFESRQIIKQYAPIDESIFKPDDKVERFQFLLGRGF